MKIVFKNPEELKAYGNNARKITDVGIEYVKTSIINFGMLNPIVIDKNDVIICGHVTCEACKRLGKTSVACVLADDLTPAQVKAYRLADNKVASMAIWDKDKLREEFDYLVTTDFTFDQLGFDKGQVMGTTTTAEGDEGAAERPKNTSTEVNLDDFEDDAFEYECPHCGLKFNQN